MSTTFLFTIGVITFFVIVTLTAGIIVRRLK